MTPLEDFAAWLKLQLLPADYSYSRGMWVDSTELASRRVVSYRADGGGAPREIHRTQRVRLIVLGPQKSRAIAGLVPAIEADCNAILDRIMGGDFKYGCLTQIRATGDIMGPGYTTEDRCWYELSLELVI